MKRLAICLLILTGCGGDPISPEAEALSAFMSIANVRREPILNAGGEIVGVTLSADVVHTGPIPVISPFIMTWRLRDPNDGEIARKTHRFVQFGVGQAQQVGLTMSFAARSSLSGLQDVVTFDFEDPQSTLVISQRNSAAMVGAGVCLRSLGGPWSTCAYSLQGWPV